MGEGLLGVEKTAGDSRQITGGMPATWLQEHMSPPGFFTPRINHSGN